MNVRLVLNNNIAIWEPVRERYSDLLETCLGGLTEFVDPSNIDIWYVPPILMSQALSLKDRGFNVHFNPTHPLSKYTKYAFKFYMFENIVDDMIIMDVDTYVKNDPHLLIRNTRGFASRADPSSYRNPNKSNIIDWAKLDEAVKHTGADWDPPIICNGHMVFKDKERTIEYRENLMKYFIMFIKGEIDMFMPKRYILFMASMLSVVETYPREDIWFVSPEEIAIERYEHVRDRYIFMERQRL